MSRYFLATIALVILAAPAAAQSLSDQDVAKVVDAIEARLMQDSQAQADDDLHQKILSNTEQMIREHASFSTLVTRYIQRQENREDLVAALNASCRSGCQTACSPCGGGGGGGCSSGRFVGFFRGRFRGRF